MLSDPGLVKIDPGLSRRGFDSIYLVSSPEPTPISLYGGNHRHRHGYKAAPVSLSQEPAGEEQLNCTHHTRVDQSSPATSVPPLNQRDGFSSLSLSQHLDTSTDGSGPATPKHCRWFAQGLTFASR